MHNSSMLKSVPIHELQDQLESDSHSVLIDVRTPAEFALGHVRGARNIPLGSMVPAQVAAEWGREAEGKPIYVICQSGLRSQRFVEDLSRIGFQGALCVAGGTLAWQAAGLPVARMTKPRAVLSVDRQARLVVGSLIAVACVLGYTVHSDFFALGGAVGGAVLISGATGGDAMASLLRFMPWNR